MTSLFTSQTPTSTNNSDGAPGITPGLALQFAVDGEVTGVRFWATDTVSGTYTVSLWDVTAADPNGSGGTLLASATMGSAPIPSGWNSVNFVTPVAVITTKLYKVSYFSSAGRYVFSSSIFGSPLVNGDITAPAHGSNPIGLGNLNQGCFTINGSNSYPTSQPGGPSNYFADVLFTAGGLTPVTSTLEARWRVSNRVTSTLEARWRVRNIVSSVIDARWRVYNRVSTTLDSRWRVMNRVVSALEARWRVANRVVSTLTVRWRVTPDVAPVTGDTAVLTAQRQATLAYIAYDPTTIVLIPSARVATSSGGFSEVDGTARTAQSVKLIELAYDQRPTVTQAGVERVIDYHLMGRWDMAIAVGDYWYDSEGTRWDVVGFSEGWDYMTKAFVARHVPREARP